MKRLLTILPIIVSALAVAWLSWPQQAPSPDAKTPPLLSLKLSPLQTKIPQYAPLIYSVRLRNQVAMAQAYKQSGNKPQQQPTIFTLSKTWPKQLAFTLEMQTAGTWKAVAITPVLLRTQTLGTPRLSSIPAQSLWAIPTDSTLPPGRYRLGAMLKPRQVIVEPAAVNLADEVATFAPVVITQSDDPAQISRRWELTALFYTIRGNCDAVMDASKKAIRADKRNFYAWQYQGDCYLKNNNWSAAIAAYEKLMNSLPTHARNNDYAIAIHNRLKLLRQRTK